MEDKISKEDMQAIERISAGFTMVILRELMYSDSRQFNPALCFAPLADTFAKCFIAIENVDRKTPNMAAYFDHFEKNVRELFCKYRTELKKKG